jgi:signal transduction histidine kinase
MPALRPTIRSRLFALVGFSLLTLVLLVGASVIIARRIDRQLETIQHAYLPRVDLQPRLEGEFEKLRRSFQDAVAIRDEDALKLTTTEGRVRFLQQLDSAKGAVQAGDAAALRDVFEDYFVTATDVSRRLIAGETGEDLVDAIGAMQAKQTTVTASIRTTTALDPDELADAFARVARLETTARSWELWMGVGCLVPVVLLTAGLSRSLLRSVSELDAGFARFGRGQFDLPIVITTRDELADVAYGANRMAENLDRIDRERAHAESALQMSNRELEAFSYSVAHDLRAPLRAIHGFSRVLVEDCADALDADGRKHLDRITAAAERMGHLIDALLSLARVARVEVTRERVDMSKIVGSTAQQLRAGQPDRVVEFDIASGIEAQGDPTLLRALFENLLGNAWKFTGKTEHARIVFESTRESGRDVYHVRDNGAGFEMAYATKLFAPFQRLHSADQFAGTGIGLATVQRIVQRHGGRIWAEGKPNEGASFHFTLWETPERENA